MARELRIGRPDLARTYDDGGLVDLNSAPPQVIAGVCGIDLTVAAQIAHARVPGAPFATVDDVFSLTEIPYPLWDRIRDRAVVITS
jgi:DNA uptake protein ComE-like DNA-binding protein